jgi:deoxyribodipyrimidine photo-lyase
MTPFGSQKCGAVRAKFLLDSVMDLRKNLEKKGSGLVVAYGKPEEVLSKLCRALEDELADGQKEKKSEQPVLLKPSVVVQEEPASEEYQVDRAVQRAVKSFASGSLETVWAATLYDLEDLPFNNGVQGMPDTFTPFRNKVEKVSSVVETATVY